MVSRFCRRRVWVKFMWWTVALSVLFLVIWTYRSWVMHGVNILSSPEYRECENRRNEYSIAMSENDKKMRKPLFVTMGYHGRLGNWMFQYASLLGIAKANGLTPYFPYWHSLSFSFQLTKKSPDEADCLTVVDDPKPMSYVEKLNHLPKANITLDGYFQSWKYFESINDQIRKEFNFASEVEQALQKKFESYVGRQVRAGREVISIHVRRGDMVSGDAKRLGFKPAPAEYFANAVRYMVKRHPYSVFLVVSDDIEWCRNNIRTVRLKYYKEMKGDVEFGMLSGGDDSNSKQRPSRTSRIFVVSEKDGSEEPMDSDAKNVEKLVSVSEKANNANNKNANDKNVNDNNDNANNDDIPNDDNELSVRNKDDNDDDFIYLRSPPIVIIPTGNSITDFGLLTLANHSVMSVGTFGWWGAWLADGDVVYYDDWPAKHHAVYYQWTKADFFPPHWVALSRGSRGVVVSHLFSFSVFFSLALQLLVTLH